MRKINGKLFLYELKNTYLLPVIWAGVYLLAQIFDCCVIASGKETFDMEKGSEFFLYTFYAIVIGVFAYRTFSTKKAYEKMRINPERLFLVRILYVFAYCFLFTTLLVGLGTLRLQLIKTQDFKRYVTLYRTAVYAYQGKTAWYALFGVAVGMTGAITYSITVFIENLIFSQERWYLKIVWAVALFSAVVLAHFVASVAFTFPGLGYDEYFSTPIPFGGITYANYVNYFLYAYVGEPAVVLQPDPQVLFCALSWNVTNVWTLLTGIGLIAFSFFSIGFLNRGQNETYSYEYEKERK